MPACLLTDNEARQYIADNDTGHLATCGADGQPYVVPLNYIFLNESIYFHCAHEGKKLDNLKTNDKVCFEISHTDKIYLGNTPCKCGTRYTSVLVFGKACIIEDVTEKILVLNELTKKITKGRQYASIDQTMAGSCTVVGIKIDGISGKRNVDPAQV